MPKKRPRATEDEDEGEGDEKTGLRADDRQGAKWKNRGGKARGGGIVDGSLITYSIYVCMYVSVAVRAWRR